MSYITSDISFQEVFSEASSHGFQSSFSKALHPKEVLASIPREIALFGDTFGVL